MNIGYIGMGIMGSPMATNLLGAGHTVTVWNRTASKCNDVQAAGASVAESPAALAANAQVVFLNLTDTPDVEEVVFGEGGVAAGASDGTIIVDNSTINPEKTKEFAQRLESAGVAWVDAPVSGGDVGAKKGTLSIMVGGGEEAFNKVKPLLDVLGDSVIHLGGTGAGQACKACNQVAVVNNLRGVCEAIALAKATGLDPKQMIEVVSGGAGGSWQLANLGPRIVDGDFDPGFMIKLVLKDLGIVLDAAQTHELELAATQLARDTFAQVKQDGGGGLGTQAMAKAVKGAT